MDWRPAGWSMCLPLLIFPCTIKSRSSLLAPAHPGGPGKKGRKTVVVWCGNSSSCSVLSFRVHRTEEHATRNWTKRDVPSEHSTASPDCALLIMRTTRLKHDEQQRTSSPVSSTVNNGNTHSSALTHSWCSISLLACSNYQVGPATTQLT